jgi:hypothetical protein
MLESKHGTWKDVRKSALATDWATSHSWIHHCIMILYLFHLMQYIFYWICIQYKYVLILLCDSHFIIPMLMYNKYTFCRGWNHYFCACMVGWESLNQAVIFPQIILITKIQVLYETSWIHYLFGVNPPFFLQWCIALRSRACMRANDNY